MTPIDRNFYTSLTIVALFLVILFLFIRSMAKSGVSIKNVLNINSIFARNRFLLKSMDVVPEALVVINEHGKIEYTNDKAILYFGWTSEEMMKQELSLFVPLEYLAEVDTFKLLHSHEKADRHLEIQAVKRDKTRFPVDVTFRKWHDVENVTNEFYIIAIRDISHRKANEEAVRIARVHLDKISTISSRGMLALKGGAWDWDMVEDVVYYDEGFRILFGLKTGEIVRAKDLMDVVYFEDRNNVNLAMIKASKPKENGNFEPYDIQYRVNKKNGTKDLIRCLGVPKVNKNNKIIGIEGAIILMNQNVI